MSPEWWNAPRGKVAHAQTGTKAITECGLIIGWDWFASVPNEEKCERCMATLGGTDHL